MTDDPLRPISEIIAGAIAEADEHPDEPARVAEGATVAEATPPASAKPRAAKKHASTTKAPPAAEAAHAPRQDDGEPYDVEAINASNSLVIVGGRPVVMRERLEGAVGAGPVFWGLDAFKNYNSNTSTEVRVPGGQVRNMTHAQAWLRDRRRRSYEGIEFYPDPDNKPGTPGCYNLWRGFSVKPVAKANGYAVLRDHMLTNVCQGNEEHFKWTFAFFAHIVQRPRERVGVALILRGKQGAGKSIVGEAFGSLLGSAYLLVDSSRYVTGNFNIHLAGCLLLEADEATWAGDKAAEGRLKGMVTSSVQQIESKGVDSVPVKNFVRLMMTSNEPWVTPAGPEERRFAVFEVDPRCVGNHGYFREMKAELDAGGREALLYDLLHFDLDSVDLRTIPKTRALLDQKERSLDSVQSWWLTRLDSGRITRNAPDWERLVSKKVLYDDYIEVTDRVGVRRRREETILHSELRELVPGLRNTRPTIRISHPDGPSEVKRDRCYEVPSLAACRAHWDEIMNQPRQWPEEDDDQTEPGERANGGDF